MTRPLSPLAAQTLPAANTTQLDVTGAGKSFNTRPVRGSTRAMWAPRATQSDPAPAAIPAGLLSRGPAVGTDSALSTPTLLPLLTPTSAMWGPLSSVTQAVSPSATIRLGTKGSAT